MAYSVLVLDLERDVVESNDRTWSKVIYAGDAIFLAPGFLTSSQPYLHMDIYMLLGMVMVYLDIYCIFFFLGLLNCAGGMLGVPSPGGVVYNPTVQGSGFSHTRFSLTSKQTV